MCPSVAWGERSSGNARNGEGVQPSLIRYENYNRYGATTQAIGLNLGNKLSQLNSKLRRELMPNTLDNGFSGFGWACHANRAVVCQSLSKRVGFKKYALTSFCVRHGHPTVPFERLSFPTFCVGQANGKDFARYPHTLSCFGNLK